MFHRVLFLGSKKSGLEVLKEIYTKKPESVVACVTVDDSADSRSVLNEIQDFCKAANLPMEVLTGSCDITDCIERYHPDLCIVMGWYYIIKPELLKRVKGGFLGIHNSLLPLYRGFAPTVWAMINGEQRTGFSVFSFDEGMDTGKLWYQKEIIIHKTDYISDVLDKIDVEVRAFFHQNYRKILDGTMIPYEQDNIPASYGSKRTAADGRIDWTKNAMEIYNFVRAQSKPYPGAFTYYAKKKVTVWKSSVFECEAYGTPGQISMIDKNAGTVVVVCGGHTGLILNTVEVAGKEISPVRLPASLNRKFE